MFRVTLITLALAAAASSGFESADGKPLSSRDRATLERGELLVQLTAVEGSNVKRAVAVALVDAAPEAVFAVLTDYGNFTRFMPYCEKVEVRKTEADKSTVYFSLDFPWPIGDRHYVLNLTDRKQDVDGQPVYTSSWTYEPKSGNINDATGSWEVRAYDARRSYVRYTVFTDPGGSIPNWANNAATEVAVPKVINGLRARVAEVHKQPTPASPPETRK